MKVLVTGSNGFIGKNLCLHLSEGGYEVFRFDTGNTDDELRLFIAESDFVVHLAGINRPLAEKEFIDGNVNFTKKFCDLIRNEKPSLPILFASSTQATLDNAYGRSKKAAEDLVLAHAEECGSKAYVARFYNVYGKWCRPNYNSVIATFCYNVANGLPLDVNPSAPSIDFVYIDDLCGWVISVIKRGISDSDRILYPEPHFTKTLPQIVELLEGFRVSRNNHMVPAIDDPFAKRLYSTYLSYLPESSFSYPLDMHVDSRGSFTEILKTIGNGQISVNVAKPGITKGNHYHHTKTEKYLVVHGECEIKFRRIDSDKVITYHCSDKKLEVVDIPPGYTHSITNVGEDDSVTLMWANELFDPDHSDTYPCPVERT